MRRPLPIAVAIADVSALLAYIVGIDPALIQAGALAFKVLLVPWLLRHESITRRQGSSFLWLILLCAVSLIFSDMLETRAIVQIVTFLANLAITLLLVPEEVGTYLRWIARLIAASAMLYVGMWAAGLITGEWGRPYYFNHTHPNLGSEIGAMGVLCGAVSIKYRGFLVLVAPMLASAMLMQGRAAVLAIVLSVLLRSLHEFYLLARSRRAQLGIILAGPAGMAVAIFAAPFVIDAMLLGDRYRGEDTGFVGRTDHWQMAWDAFLANPLTGRGLGSYAGLDVGTPHNFFLYGLAEMGLLSVPLFLMLIFMAVKAARIHGWKIATLSPILIMFFMNDRFMNLNPYPFVAWVLFFALSMLPEAHRAVDPGRGFRRETPLGATAIRNRTSPVGRKSERAAAARGA